MGGLPTGTVSFLLTDVPGSTALWEAAPDATAVSLARLDSVVEAAAARFGGFVVKPRGENDSHFLVFDSPSGAIAAALRLGQTVGAEALVAVRMAVTTGPAELRDGDYLGPAVNHCARLRAAAHAGQIVVGAPTATSADLPPGAALVDLGWHWLKDLDRPLRAFELRHPELPADSPPLASLAPPAVNLPRPITSFVGRDAEVAEVVGALQSGAPVTVTGAPGVGKSRLALEVATAVGRSGQSLVRFLAAEDGVAPIVATTVPTIVVLDDADPSRGQVRDVVDGRPRAGELAVLATARGPLGVEGEVVVRVAPLAEDDAQRLLAERAERARSGLDLGSSIGALTELLSGLPLAVELAAARLAVLTPEQLLSRLATPERVLTARAATPARHRSMSDAVAWSIGALDPAARAALAELAAGKHVAPPIAERLVELGWAEPGPAGPGVLGVLGPFLRAAVTAS